MIENVIKYIALILVVIGMPISAYAEFIASVDHAFLFVLSTIIWLVLIFLFLKLIKEDY